MLIYPFDRSPLRFTFISVAIETVLGLAIALVVNMNLKGRGMMRVFMLVPWVIPTAGFLHIGNGCLPQPGWAS